MNFNIFKKAKDSANFRAWLLCLGITAAFFLCKATYAYWSQTPAAKNGIILNSGTVAYIETYVYAGSGSLIPAQALPDSLAENNISESVPATDAVSYAGFSLTGFSCDIIIRFEMFYLDSAGVYQSLENGILSNEVWCDLNGGNADFYNVAYDAGHTGHYIPAYPAGNTAMIMVKTRFVPVDELLDPFYKNTAFKLRIMFEAVKI